jgi:hypothetical protein
MSPLSSEANRGDERAGADSMQQASETAGRAAGAAQEEARDARDRIAELAPRAQQAVTDAVDSGRQGAADAMDRAASSLDRRAEGDGVSAMAAGAAADTMQQAAGYLRSRDTGEMWGDVEHYVRDHPRPFRADGGGRWPRRRPRAEVAR